MLWKISSYLRRAKRLLLQASIGIAAFLAAAYSLGRSDAAYEIILEGGKGGLGGAAGGVIVGLFLALARRSTG